MSPIHDTEMERRSAVSLLEALPPHPAIITLEYDPVGLWPLIIGREDVMELLVYDSLPSKEKCKDLMAESFRRALVMGKNPIPLISYHSNEGFHSAILNIIRFSAFLDSKSLQTIACVWNDLALGGVGWLLSQGFRETLGSVEIHKDLSRQAHGAFIISFGKESLARESKILLTRALRTEFDYRPSPLESEADLVQKYLRWTLRDCIASLFGLLEHFGSNPCVDAPPSPLYPYLGIWKVPLEKVKTLTAHLRGKTSGVRDITKHIDVARDVSELLKSLLDSEYPLVQTPGFRRVKEACIALLEEIKARDNIMASGTPGYSGLQGVHNIFPLYIAGCELARRLPEEIPEFAPYFACGISHERLMAGMRREIGPRGVMDLMARGIFPF